MKEKYRTLAKDTILFGCSSFVSKFMIFLLLPFYTRLLSTTDYGIIDIITNLNNLFYPLLTLSIVEATLRFAFSNDIKKNELLTNSLLLIFSSIGILLILTPFSCLFGNIMQNNWWNFIALFSGYSLQNLFSCYCRGNNKTTIFAMQGIVQTVCLLVFNLFFLAILRWGKNGYFLSLVCSYYLAVFFMVIFGKIYKELYPFKLNLTLLKEMLRYSFPLIPSMMAWWINNSADKYTIIGIIGISASGIYAAAHKIPTILTTVSDIFNQAFLISAVNNINETDRNSYFTTVSQYFFIVNCIGCSCLVAASELTGKILFSKDFLEGWIYIPMLLFAAYFSNLSAYLASFFRTIKNTHILFKSTIIGALFNIALNIILINVIGVLGAAIATAISFWIVFIIRNTSLKKIVDIQLINRKNIYATFLIGLEVLFMSIKFEFRYAICCIVIISIAILYRNNFQPIIIFIKNRKILPPDE